jgi:hypothetical protein
VLLLEHALSLGADEKIFIVIGGAFKAAARPPCLRHEAALTSSMATATAARLLQLGS